MKLDRNSFNRGVVQTLTLAPLWSRLKRFWVRYMEYRDDPTGRMSVLDCIRVAWSTTKRTQIDLGLAKRVWGKGKR